MLFLALGEKKKTRLGNILMICCSKSKKIAGDPRCHWILAGYRGSASAGGPG